MISELPPDIRAVVEPLCDGSVPPGDVAFDADGTLWRGDLGEDLLRYLLAERHLVHASAQNGGYREYERRHAANPQDAYTFAVKVMAGVAEAKIRALCHDFFTRRFHGRLFRHARLLRRLGEAGHRVWIVSASPLCAVAAAADLVGVKVERIIGIASSCDSAGLLTETILEPIPCFAGKVAALESRGVNRLLLAAGNGALDLPMLEHAERAFVVAPHDEDTVVVPVAKDRGWPILRA